MGKHKKNINYWHEPFFEALQLELYEYRDVLNFKEEHKLSKEALRVDVLVIKKTKNVEIKKNIGSIFEDYNLFEFKSETLSLSLSSYNKVLGYAFIYSSFNGIPIENITISFVISKRPLKLFKHLKTLNFEIKERSTGIYEVTNERVKTQIIVRTKLSLEENAFLKNLRSNLKVKELEHILEKYSKYDPLDTKKTYLSRILDANINILEEVINSMTEQMADNLEEVIGRTFLAERFLMKGRQEGIQKGIQEGRQKGIQEGRQKGIQEGRQKGIQEGRQKGIQEGRQKGIEIGTKRAVETISSLINDGYSLEEALKKVISK